MSRNISVTIRCFSLIKEETGQSTIKIDIAQDSDTGMVYQDFIQKYPRLRNMPVRIALNKEYIVEKTILRDGDEIAFIPPVSGG